MWCLVFPVSFLEETALSPLSGLGTLVKDYLITDTRIYFWVLYAILFYSVFVLGPYCFNHCSFMCVCVCTKLLQSCPTLCDPMDCSLPGSFVHGIFQARILEWKKKTKEYWSGLLCPPPEDVPDPGIEPAPLMSPALAGGFFTTSSTWEAHCSFIMVSNQEVWALQLCFPFPELFWLFRISWEFTWILRWIFVFSKTGH